MKVFISWSGNKSRKIAEVFKEWLPLVIQIIKPFHSSEDINKGARWNTDVANELENSRYGILCITKENLNEPWITFEAGALSKNTDKSIVCPFLFDVEMSDVNEPISQFQCTIFEKEDVKKLVKTLNKESGRSINDANLETIFDSCYPKLEEKLNKLKDESISLPQGVENFLQSEYEIKFTYHVRDNLDNQIVDHYYFTLNVTWDEIWAAILPTMNVGEASLKEIESSLTIFLIKCANELFREKKINLKFNFRTNNSINLRNHLINKVLSHFVDSELIKEKNIKDSRTHWTLSKYGKKLMKQSRSTNKRKPKGKIVRAPFF